MTATEYVEQLIKDGDKEAVRLMQIFLHGEKICTSELPLPLQNVANVMETLRGIIQSEPETSEQMEIFKCFAYCALMNMTGQHIKKTLKQFLPMIGAEFEIKEYSKADLSPEPGTVQ